jgi:ribonuclease PH
MRYDMFGYADASVVFEMGRTKILVGISLQDGVPKFLKGQKTGWLTAEYAMLPCSTHRRSNRESSQSHRNFRNVEISRLIGRVLRTVVDLEKIPEKTIVVDCDVLQADGGTRVASISAVGIALQVAVNRWLEKEVIKENIMEDQIAAISAGIVQNELFLDLSYREDSIADADFNFVFTKSGKLIEVQGTAEKKPVSWDQFEQLKVLAQDGIAQLFASFEYIHKQHETRKNKKPPLFSLANRL